MDVGDTLKRIDGWYADKFRRNYADENANEAITRIVEYVHKSGRKQLAVDLVIYGGLIGYNRQGQIREAETYFQEAYPTAQRITSQLVKENVLRVSQGTLDEYLTPLADQLAVLERFVTSLSNLSGEKKVSQLTERQVDGIFIEHFGSHQGFSNFSKAYLKAANMCLDLISRQRNSPISAEDTLSLELSDFISPYIIETVLGDLPT